MYSSGSLRLSGMDHRIFGEMVQCAKTMFFVTGIAILDQLRT